MYGIFSIANHCVFVAAVAAVVEEVAPEGRGIVHKEFGKICKSSVHVEDDDKAWGVEGIITAGETEDSGVHDKLRALLEKCLYRSGISEYCRKGYKRMT